MQYFSADFLKNEKKMKKTLFILRLNWKMIIRKFDDGSLFICPIPTLFNQRNQSLYRFFFLDIFQMNFFPFV